MNTLTTRRSVSLQPTSLAEQEIAQYQSEVFSRQCGTLCLEDMGLTGISDAERNVILNSFFHLRGKTPSILIVDDDVELSWLLETNLRRALPQADISIANDPYEGLNLLLEKEFNLVVLDWNLQGINGREMLDQADHEMDLDPSLPDDRYSHRPKVVVLSADPKKKCKLGRFEHFKPVGHIHKMQKLDQLIDSIKTHYWNG
jgi:CheY-like chemotaxis protein